MPLGTPRQRVAGGRAVIQIAAGVTAAFVAAGLGFDELMHGDIGELVSAEAEREVRRLRVPVVGGPALSLLVKRNWERIPVSWVLKKLVRGRVQRSRTWSEAEALAQLWRDGFPVNEPVAWGEARRLGVPREGFLVVREVDGTEASKVWTTAGPRLRERLIADLGTVVGRLHRAHFPECVRIKDVFCCVPHDASQPIPFFLIDRELSRGKYRRVNADILALALARSYIGFLALDAEPTLRQLVRFHRADAPLVSEFRDLAAREFLARVARALPRVAAESRHFADALARSRYVKLVRKGR